MSEFDFENRIVTPEYSPGDVDVETTLRPRSLAEYIGQDKVKDNLDIYIKAAKLRGESLDHCLLYGPPGLGKTTLAGIIANKMGVNLRITSGPAIEKQGDLAALLTNLNEGDVLFIDEIHRISQRLQESLYFAMEQFEADVVVDGVATRVSLPHFTLIAATNLYGGLNDALLNRFPIQIKLAAYSKNDMASIVEKICQEKKIKIDEESIYKIAATTRGIPRNANSYVARVYDFALVMNNGVINPEIVDEALYVMGINKFGLNQDDMDYMNFLNSNTRAVGVDTICLTLGMDKDTVQTKIEPYLLSKGYIQKQPRGRVITDLGRSMMGECE